jgi:transcriptional regulator with XRE-family HTH domain
LLQPARRFSRRTLRELRVEAGITIEQVATDVDLSPYSVADYELGRRTPSVNGLILLAERFGIAIDDLFEDVE